LEVNKMIVNARKLREALDLLGPVLPGKKPSLEVLTNVLLKDGQIMATNLETFVAVELEGADEPCLLPFKEVSSLLKTIPGNSDLSIEQEGKQVRFSWTGGKASFGTMGPEDYPAMPDKPVEVSGAVNGDILVRGLMAVVDYCQTDEARPVLTGVWLFPGERVEAVGADGFRMARQDLPLSYPADGIPHLIIPAGSVRILSHLWARAPKTPPTADSLADLVSSRRPLVLAVGGGFLKVLFGPVILTSQLIQGTPPPSKAGP